LPFEDFNTLRKESFSEGFNFLNRLEKDWFDNKNQFNKQGESYWLIRVENQILD
jgi:hypothetical protein